MLVCSLNPAAASDAILLDVQPSAALFGDTVVETGTTSPITAITAATIATGEGPQVAARVTEKDECVGQSHVLLGGGSAATAAAAETDEGSKENPLQQEMEVRKVLLHGIGVLVRECACVQRAFSFGSFMQWVQHEYVCVSVAVFCTCMSFEFALVGAGATTRIGDAEDSGKDAETTGWYMMYWVAIWFSEWQKNMRVWCCRRGQDRVEEMDQIQCDRAARGLPPLVHMKYPPVRSPP